MFCYHTVHVYVVILFCDSIFFLWKKICLGFALYFNIHIVIRNPIINKEGGGGGGLCNIFYIGQSETRISYGSHARFLSNLNEMRNFSR